MKKIFFPLLITAWTVLSCVSLDIPPKNIVSDDDLMGSQSGMSVYLTRLYTQMPWEDFKYIASRGFDGNSWLGCLGVEGTGEAVTRDDICVSFTSESASWWGRAFTLIHDANHLIETLPKYRDRYPEVTYNEFLGQGYFIRAYAYTQMARRFGGVPIVKNEISYPFEGEIEVPRSSERQTWDAILEDWDLAASLLPTVPTFEDTPNRYAALAFKAEAMLYAGSVAKYNEQVAGRLTGLGEKTKVRVIGFAEAEWQECSNRYFAEAYKAAAEVIASGRYSLYRKSWAAGDKEAQYKNMNDMWRDLTSPENILVREYSYPILSHGLDAYSSPWIYRMPLSAGTCPTEDLLELFDGFDRYPDGTIRVTDGASHTLGTYLLFDEPMDFFRNAEPRLRAYVIFPGDVFKKTPIEVRTGIYTGPLPIAPLRDNYDFSQRGRFYQHMAQYTDESNRTLFLSPNVNTGEVTYVDGKTGETVTTWAAGQNGPFFSNAEATMTGLYLRKYLDPDRPLEEIGEGKSDQPFILMRYAEVLLAAAEAAVELSLAGQPSPIGDDMLLVATDAIRDIQNRAGATELSTKLSASLESRDLVRKERRKELAFEQKSKWDIRRWRVIDERNRDGFWGVQTDHRSWSDGNRFAFKGLYPFYSTQAGKWFFDICFENRKTFSYAPANYYFAIPSGEVTKSLYIDQQPNR
ncbi:MAG: RagB/SusD family nutrient uptake outer membrane protein [Bacteroidales bacterium]|nr:RagB/SusD family nutrient uptake outer membrane protein [Bacteroidales bacterium]